RHDSFPFQDGAESHEGIMKQSYGVSAFRKRARCTRQPRRLFVLILLIVSLSTMLGAPAGAALAIKPPVDSGSYEGQPDDPPHYSNEPGRVTYSTVQQNERQQAQWLSLYTSLQDLLIVVAWSSR